MSTPDPTSCSRADDRPSGRTCLEQLAAGWTGVIDDLCPSCTAQFMAALNAAVPGLRWHENYLKRAVAGNA